MSANPLAHPDQAVPLRDIERVAGALFRALGADAALRVAPGPEEFGAWRQDDTLRVPAMIAPFPDARLNRELYLWWIALAAHLGDEVEVDDDDWSRYIETATQRTLDCLPGLRGRFERLSAAAEGAHAATLMGLNPPPPARDPADARRAKPVRDEDDDEGDDRDRDDKQRKITHTVKLDRSASMAEFINVTREGEEDKDEPEKPQSRGMEGSTDMARIKFDIDAPDTGHDDILVGEGVPTDEWDYRKRVLLPDHCLVQEFIGGHGGGLGLPERLRKHAARLKQQFAALVPERQWMKAQADGTEPDLDAYVRWHTDRLAGSLEREQNLYLAQVNRERDMACLVLADLSLSTEARVSSSQCVIDVIRDSLMLFAEALGATGDKFGLYGFSSRTRQQVRFHRLKEFGSRFDDVARARVDGLKPGYYTRIGPALRHATRILERQDATMRVLLVLTDGKPHDIDYYEERYGIEDTRMAVMHARKRRIKPFCVTIDREGSYYLPHLFGVNGYTVLRRPEELTRRLPLLYAQLTGES